MAIKNIEKPTCPIKSHAPKSPDEPKNSDNILVLKSLPVKTTQKERLAQAKSERKTVVDEIIQAIRDHEFDGEDQFRPFEKIANKAIKDGVFTNGQMKGILEEIGNRIGREAYTDWRLTSKKNFENKTKIKPEEEVRDAFMAGDILVSPSRVQAGEINENQTPNFEPAYKRGVLRAIQEIRVKSFENEENFNKAVKDLYIKSTSKYDIFEKNELKTHFKDALITIKD